MLFSKCAAAATGAQDGVQNGMQNGVQDGDLQYTRGSNNNNEDTRIFPFLFVNLYT